MLLPEPELLVDQKPEEKKFGARTGKAVRRNSYQHTLWRDPPLTPGVDFGTKQSHRERSGAQGRLLPGEKAVRRASVL